MLLVGLRRNFVPYIKGFIYKFIRDNARVIYLYCILDEADANFIQDPIIKKAMDDMDDELKGSSIPKSFHNASGDKVGESFYY